jgi:hypothetical protein
LRRFSFGGSIARVIRVGNTRYDLYVYIADVTAASHGTTDCSSAARVRRHPFGLAFERHPT